MSDDGIVVDGVKLAEKIDDEYYATEQLKHTLTDSTLDPTDPLFIGYHADTETRGLELVGLTPASIQNNVAVVGERASGKTTLLQPILVQLAARGQGFCLIEERRGDAIRLLGQLPDDRLDDVIWIGPDEEASPTAISDDQHVRLSPLAPTGPDATEATLRAVASDVTELALAELDDGTTRLADLPRDVLVPALADPEVETLHELERVVADEVHPNKPDALQKRIKAAPGDGAALRQAIQDAQTDDPLDPDPLLQLRNGLRRAQSPKSRNSTPNTGLDIPAAVENDRIIIATGGTRLTSIATIQTTLLRRFWCAAQQAALPERAIPYPLVVDGLGQSLPGTGTALRDCLRLADDRLGVVVGSLAPGTHQQPVARALRSWVETMLVTTTTFERPLAVLERSGFDTTTAEYATPSSGCFWLHRGTPTDPFRAQSFNQLPPDHSITAIENGRPERSGSDEPTQSESDESSASSH